LVEYRKGAYLDTFALIQGDIAKPQIALIFTGHKYADGGSHIRQVLKQQQVPGSFFFTGVFYEQYASLVRQLKGDGHYGSGQRRFSARQLLRCALPLQRRYLGGTVLVNTDLGRPAGARKE
jgi:hypothetical protein